MCMHVANMALPHNASMHVYNIHCIVGVVDTFCSHAIYCVHMELMASRLLSPFQECATSAFSALCRHYYSSDHSTIIESQGACIEVTAKLLSKRTVQIHCLCS